MFAQLVVSMVIQTTVPMTPLTQRDLLSHFRDVTVRSVAAFSAPEGFFRDGAYRRQARVLIQGRFWIDGAELCVADEADATPFCRTFSRDGRGTVYLTGMRRGDVVEVLEPTAINSQSME